MMKRACSCSLLRISLLVLMDWMCVALGRDPEVDAGNYDGGCRLIPSQTKMVSHLPGSIQERFSCLEGSDLWCSPPAPVFLPVLAVQRVMTLEPSLR